MAVEVSKMMTVTDAVLENKILKAIIKDFNPIEFLQMLKEHSVEAPECAEIIPASEVFDQHDDFKLSMVSEVPEVYASTKFEHDAAGDIKKRDNGGYKIFSRKSRKKKDLPLCLPATIVKPELVDETQSVSTVLAGPGLLYIGNASLPPVIQVSLAAGELFTIGRIDTTIGKKKSSFEFDKKTKAVSQRHAAIERDNNCYLIIDLSSSAGTYINNKRLPPNTPYELKAGTRVSFGNCGADYVWEVN